MWPAAHIFLRNWRFGTRLDRRAYVGYYSSMRCRPLTLTVTLAAERLGLKARYVRSLCDSLKIGERINERLRLLSESDLPKIQQAAKKKGRPKKVAS